ncbi:MAG: hypothetical protein ACE5PO_09485, partial [Candidatus Bathyarchaeia archaeon]
MDTTVEFMGLTFRNPVFAAAGYVTRDYKMIKRLIDHGIGGVVIKTIKDVPEQVSPRPRLAPFHPALSKSRTLGIQNIDG